jgi:hypothetical protein
MEISKVNYSNFKISIFMSYVTWGYHISITRKEGIQKYDISATNRQKAECINGHDFIMKNFFSTFLC